MVSSKGFLDIQTTIGWGVNLKRVWDMIRTYSLEKILWEPWRNYLKLFGILLHSQGFTQAILRFLFRLVFFTFEIITVAITIAPVPHSSYCQLKQRSKCLNKRVCMVICLSHWIILYKLYCVRARWNLKPNESHTNRIINFVYETSLIA